MNLHAVVSGAIETINPRLLLNVQVSVGDVTSADGSRVPAYATPGSITASVATNVLTASSITSGILQVGQQLADLTNNLIVGTQIVGQLSGPSGGLGTYLLNQSQTVLSEPMTTALMVQGQVQPISWRDLQQLQGLNLQGDRNKIYFYGRVDGVIRPGKKGGDLVTAPDGSVYLIAQVLEQWNGRWCSVAATLQNGS